MSAATSSRSCATWSRSRIALTRERKRKDVQARAQQAAEERVLDALVGAGASAGDRGSFPPKLRAGELDDKEIEIEVQSARRHADVRDSRHAGRADGRDLDRRYFRQARRRAHQDAARHGARIHEILINEESDKLLDSEQLVQEAIKAVEQNGIVFLDEIDKICARDGRIGGDVSREGVQRDLLPLIEGTTVVDQARAGEDRPHPVHRLGRVPHRRSRPTCCPSCRAGCRSASNCKALTRDDFRRILTEPEASLIKQYIALMATEGVTLEFTEDAIDAIADIAVAVNSSVENIGARRLQTVMERVLDEVSFAAPDRSGETVKIDAAYVEKHIGDLAKNADLSRFIL